MDCRVRFRTISILLALLPSLTGCLVNQEDITIRSDGSAVVRIGAIGGVEDLADGFPVPLDGPWKPVGDAARSWLAHIGPDTGSEAVRDKVRALKRSGELERIAPDGKMALTVEATFASVEDWPRHLAPPSAPHRTAYVERSARLEVQKKESRRVYQFERVFHRRKGPGRVWDRVDAYLPKELKEKFEKKELPTRAEWLRAVPVVSRAFQDFFERVARDALVELYTSGEASPPVESLEEIIGKNRRAVDSVVTAERLGRIYDWIRDQMESAKPGAKKEEATASPDEPNRLDQLEIDVRKAVRASLTGALSEAGLTDAERRAALSRLDRGYAAIDQTVDLLNETFEVKLTLPGVVVGGNYDRRTGANQVQWKFEAKDLEKGDRVLGAVSVLE